MKSSLARSLRAVFSEEKMIPTKTGNLLGLQVARVALSRALEAQRRRRRDAPPCEQTRALERDGYCVIPNFLPRPVYEEVYAEYCRAMENDRPRSIRDSGGVVREAIYINDGKTFMFDYEGVHRGQATPRTVEAVYENQRLRDLLMTSAGLYGRRFDTRRFQMAFWRYRVADDADADVLECPHTNGELHSDSFHTIIKAFLYLRPADADSGAHRFVPRSHRVSAARLWFEYLNSIGEQRDSPRVSMEQLHEMGLEVKDLCFPENTLIVENTFGFHAAGRILPGRQRDIIYMQYRVHPFRPLGAPAG